ncbi:MAG: gltX [Candidatus Berkelbacteria bacterium]|nr:gltX [Candidatus Berkelbacteria bacterium]
MKIREKKISGKEFKLNMNDEIRVRIAPSPTGYLHIGTAHTALFNWLFARQKNGKFILRIEDTDTERSKEEFVTDITDGLSWLGIDWDEGPERNEPFGPYKQSDRLQIYQDYAEKLLKENKAYYCYCTAEELIKEREVQEQKKLAPKYSGKCRNLTNEQVKKCQAEGRKPTIRFIVEPKKIAFTDLVKGDIEFDTSLFGDFVIMKSDGRPVFLFAGAIDDFMMKISHVIRGEDHLSNTPRQILLGEALNFFVPEYGHLPLILNPDRTKLSKRKNPTSINKDFRNTGYLPEAMINFIAIMGWSAKNDQELWTLKDLINEFNFRDVGKSPAVFDGQKLNYLNGYYIRKMSVGELSKAAEPFLQKAGLSDGKDKLLSALSLVQERVKKLSDIPELIEFFFKNPEFSQDLLIMKNSTKEKIKIALEESYKHLFEESDFGRDSLEQLLRAVAAKNNLKAGEVLWPLRVALTGKEASPGAFEVLECLGKEESLKRIKKSIDMLK